MHPTGDQQARVHTNRRDWHNLKSMMPFLWEFRGRALFALSCLVLAKAANVGVPLYLKKIVDVLDQQPEQLLVLPVALLVVYGALKLSASLFNELRDVIRAIPAEYPHFGRESPFFLPAGAFPQPGESNPARKSPCSRPGPGARQRSMS